MENNQQIQRANQGNNELTKSQSSGGLINSLLSKDYKSIQQAITSNLPSIAKINREDPELSREVVSEFISDFVEFLNVGKIMNVNQISQTAIYILQYFPHLNLADLKVFFDKMKVGHYGKFYDSVDGQLILSKLDEYNQERMNEFEQVRLAQHRETKRNDVGISGYHESVLKVLKDAIGDKQVFTEKNLVPRTKSDAEIFYDRCLAQFDNLYRKYGKQMSSERFMIIGDTRFTIDYFIERKVSNKLNK